MIKKAVFVVILMIFLTSVYARAGAKDVPMEEIEKQLTAKCDMEQMAKCDNRNLMQFLGLDYEQYDSHLYYKGKEALSVDEVLIVKVHEKDDLDSVNEWRRKPQPLTDMVRSRLLCFQMLLFSQKGSICFIVRIKTQKI